MGPLLTLINFNPTMHNDSSTQGSVGRNYLPVLGLKLIHVSKRNAPVL